MKAPREFFEVCFFHAVFEMWSGPEMIHKYSKYEVVTLKEEESVTIRFNAWLSKIDRGTVKIEGKEVASVLIFADWKTDLNYHAEIPMDLNL